jgi:prepilin-type N-terminal cleavage/methylation domain-containing protein/prepilin-type processing-associated H-X9-DG protein
VGAAPIFTLESTRAIARHPRRQLRPPPGTARAFTLVELLVVIGVIAVLAALLLPAIKSNLGAANGIKTVSNVRQTGVFLNAYAADNNNRLPLSIDWGNFWQGSGVWFQGTLNAAFKELRSQRYSGILSLNEIFYDPSLKGKPEHPWGSFGVNVSIVLNDSDCYVKYGSKDGVPLASIANLSSKVIYCSVKNENGAFASEWAFSGDEFARRGMDPGIVHPDPRNSGGAAALFADGHVEKLDVANMDDKTRRRLFVLDP